MAIDIKNVKSDDTIIKNAGIVVNTADPTGYQTLDSRVVNTPTIENISGKYTDRFDDPTYYG